jgi:hypothetical protein
MLFLSVDDYFAAYADHPDITQDRADNAEVLIGVVNALLERAYPEMGALALNPITGTLVGGEKNGGFRPQDCPIGAPLSAHKQAQAVDIYDPDGKLDKWCFEHQDVLIELGLYLEHPDATHSTSQRGLHKEGWCHLQTRKTKSGNHVFYP